MPHKDPAAYKRRPEVKARRNAQRRVSHDPDKRREYNRKNNLLRKFGLTTEQYYALLLLQNGVCAICKYAEQNTYRGRVRALAVDHDHKSGEIRGLLCTKCNYGIEGLRDDPVILESATRYLRGDHRHVRLVQELV